MIAQQVYEGIAVRGRSGEFPSEGYYAASNSFPRNSLVEVRNPSTGATIEVIIVSGISEPGLFMILSDEASSAPGRYPEQRHQPGGEPGQRTRAHVGGGESGSSLQLRPRG
jgi:hypothetical protein